MNKNGKKIDKAYSFFCEAERTKQRFTLEDISTATGWTILTVRGYLTKKWRWFLKADGDKYFCEGIISYPKHSFFRIHSQQIDDDIRNLRPRYNEQVDILIDKARESALLAVQAYNNPLTKFRTPGYLVLMNIAFTALFHAIFEYSGVEYTYKNSDGTLRMIDNEAATWELSTCADYYYKGNSAAERER